MASTASKAPRASSKKEIVEKLATANEISKQEAAKLLDSVASIIITELEQTGSFILHGVFRARVIEKPATAARESVNPFSKKSVMVKAKPARRVVKFLPAKAVKTKFLG